MLAGMAKTVHKPQQNGEDVTLELAEFRVRVSKGMSKEARDELMKKIPTRCNCNRLEVVRVNPEIFSSGRKKVKSEDVSCYRKPKRPC